MAKEAGFQGEGLSALLRDERARQREREKEGRESEEKEADRRREREKEDREREENEADRRRELYLIQLQSDVNYDLVFGKPLGTRNQEDPNTSWEPSEL